MMQKNGFRPLRHIVSLLTASFFQKKAALSECGFFSFPTPLFATNGNTARDERGMALVLQTEQHCFAEILPDSH